MKKCYLLLAIGLAVCSALPASARTQFASSGRVYRDTDQACFGGETMGTVRNNSCNRNDVYWEIPLVTDYDGGGGTVKVGYYAAVMQIGCTLAWSDVDGKYFATGSSGKSASSTTYKNGTISLAMPNWRPVIVPKDSTAFYVSCTLPQWKTVTAVGF